MYIYVGVLSCGGGQGLGTQESRGRGKQEVGIPKGWKVGETGGKYATMLHNILQLKKG